MYDFETTDFALSAEGIHLLRSRFNYKTISYEAVDKAIIKRGSEISNVFPSLLLGIALIIFAFYQAIYFIRLFADPNVHTIYIERILLPFIPALFGTYLMYVGLKKGPALVIRSARKMYKLRLRDFFKNSKSNDLKNYLSEKLSYKLEVEI